MTPLQLFDVASQHNKWLSVRQSVVAQNVANANTPGYKALDIKPFAETLEETKLDVSRTQHAHLTLGADAMIGPELEAQSADDALHSGNTVSLEEQFAKSGEVGAAFALNSGLIKSFHRMLLLSTKG